MEKAQGICAVIVTYNRKQLLVECLDALLRQTTPISGIYIIDNASQDETFEFLVKKGYVSTDLASTEGVLKSQHAINMFSEDHLKKKVVVHYIRMHENTGGAGGFCEGIQRGYRGEYDWVWIMDDDAEPSIDCLRTLLQEADREKIQCVCPLIVGNVSKKETQQLYHHKLLQKFFFMKWGSLKDGDARLKKRTVCLDGNAFVGPLIHRDIILDVGFPNKDYFIWYDDTEYTYRISKKHGLYLVPSAVIKHKDENIPDKAGRILVSIYWKQYYGIRNAIVFEATHNNFLAALLLGLHILIRKPLSMIYHREDKIGYRLKIVFMGVLDGLAKRMGRNRRVFPYKV